MISYSELDRVRELPGATPSAIPAEVFGAGEPIVLKGLVDSWPAVQASRESFPAIATYLSRFFTHQPVTVYVGDADIDGRFFYSDDFSGFNFRSGTAQLGQVFQKLDEQKSAEAPLAIYVGSTPVDGWLPGFKAQNDLALPNADALASFWLGSQTRVSAHFDFPDNIACVVAGKRRFVLFPPDQLANLYVGPLDKTPSGQAISLVDFANPDFDRFPRFRDALDAALVCELAPGDAIYIPSMWWHHVESLAHFNMLVNYWWCDTPPAMGAPTTALMHAMLCLKDLPARQKIAWKRMFDHYVFEADPANFEHIPEAARGPLAPLDEEQAAQIRAEILKRLQR